MGKDNNCQRKKGDIVVYEAKIHEEYESPITECTKLVNTIGLQLGRAGSVTI